MTTDLTPASRSTLDRLTEVPAEFWVALVAIVVVGYLLAKWTEGYDPITADYLDERAEYEARQR